MRLALSTNWCNRTIESGEEIADKAVSLGFDALELGFHTTPEQLDGFSKKLDLIPVESVHAFCPVPVSAPSGSPELYSLASLDENERAMARIHLLRTVDTASSLGARTVVLHAGRADLASFFARGVDSAFLREKLFAADKKTDDARYSKALRKALARRKKRVAKLMPLFMRELDSLIPVLEKKGVELALENLPYLEGFPNEAEMLDIVRALPGSPVKAWFDTGHHRVREMHGWIDEEASAALEELEKGGFIRGVHLNDVKDYYDDHFAPGGGNVDFAALSTMLAKAEHVVFEPKGHVSEEALAASVGLIRNTANAMTRLRSTMINL